MRLDHIAFRVAEGKRDDAAEFWIKAFGYRIQDEFPIYFDDDHKDVALCVALEPPEKVVPNIDWDMPWSYPIVMSPVPQYLQTAFHLAPEIFISQGTENSIVGQWVKSRGGYGGIHHLAYQTDDVQAKIKEWINNDWGSFTSDPILCDNGLVQVFSKPNVLGVIFEFINRGPSNAGFCKDSVKELMRSSKSD